MTHRPINEPAVDAATITFGGVLKEEEMMGGCQSRNPDEEHCPDLNLELRISPPLQHPSQPQEGRERKVLCFYCKLGLEKGKECSCCSSSRRSGHGSSSDDDLLGVQNGVLDYRNLDVERD